jgi:cryptochrome
LSCHAATTLSAHLKFGTLSSRLFYARLKQLEKENPKIKASSPPESLIGQLLWRDFFHLQQSQIENYHQIAGNRVCRYFDWRLKDKIRSKDVEAGGPEDNQDPEAEKNLRAWIDGMTGFPWIDAIMRQLKTEGWMSVSSFSCRPYIYYRQVFIFRTRASFSHHLARHSVACFLTRGHLYISWERGAEVFDDLLIDWDPSLNSGNWSEKSTIDPF